MGKCVNSAVIPAPVDEVWKRIRNFHDMSWTPAIETLERVGDARGDQVGAKRILNGAFHETLVGIDELERSFQYQITDGPSPLSKDELLYYHSEVKVLPVTDENASFVIWESRYESRDDTQIKQVCDAFYITFLAHLKAQYS